MLLLLTSTRLNFTFFTNIMKQLLTVLLFSIMISIKIIEIHEILTSPQQIFSKQSFCLNIKLPTIEKCG